MVGRAEKRKRREEKLIRQWEEEKRQKEEELMKAKEQEEEEKLHKLRKYKWISNDIYIFILDMCFLGWLSNRLCWCQRHRSCTAYPSIPTSSHTRGSFHIAGLPPGVHSHRRRRHIWCPAVCSVKTCSLIQKSESQRLTCFFHFINKLSNGPFFTVFSPYISWLMSYGIIL